MMEALMGTPEGRARLEAYEEKVDQAIADRIQASDRADDAQPRPMPENREEEREQVSARQAIEDYLPSAAPIPTERVSVGGRAATELASVPSSQDAELEEDVEDDDGDMDMDTGAVREDESVEEPCEYCTKTLKTLYHPFS